MISKNSKFRRENVIGGYRLDDFNKISWKRLIDIVPMIAHSNPSEMLILKQWENHFEALDIPFAVTSRITKHGDRDVTYYSFC